MKYLWAEWHTLKRKLLAKKEKLLLLDFDGTLAPIAKTPATVLPDAGMRRTLSRLEASPDCHVAILSGRALPDLRKRLRLRDTIYAANHGIQIRGRGLVLPIETWKAKKFKRLIRLLADEFRMVFKNFESVWVENKGYTLSLHYRSLPPKQKAAFEKCVTFFRKKYRSAPVLWTRGKRVWEIQPRVSWGKGEAALYLSRKFPRAATVAIGDDVSDEGMFKALSRRGLTIRVGYSKNSSAGYYLQSPYDVRVFLQKLCP